MSKAYPRSNILFILADQMRSTAMGCAGVEKISTPNLDRLAAEGTRFTNTVANCPSCAPARGTLFTGMHTFSHGVVNYYAHIMALDDQMERLERVLREQGLYENTIVVFTSDHGDMLGNQNQFFQSQPWRESVGIPLLMRWPGHITAGRVTDGPISHIELTASLIAMTGTVIPADMEGDDRSAFILGDDSKAPDSVFINFAPDVHIIPSPPFRVVVTRTHTDAESPEGPWLLYDDKADPFQKHNLISWTNRDNSDVVALQKSMHGKLAYWLKRTNDPFEDGNAVNDKYQPGHWGGVLPQHPAPDYSVNAVAQSGGEPWRRSENAD